MMTTAAGDPLKSVLQERAGGVLLHPTALPGRYEIGDLGPGAYRFLDWLQGAECNLWQVLPLGPTGYGDSPYQCFSAFAGNPSLISPELLLRDGLLEESEIAARAEFDPGWIDYGYIWHTRRPMLIAAAKRVLAQKNGELQERYSAFCEAQAHWLPDFALFMTLKNAFEGRPWVAWERELVQRKPAALKRARKQFADRIAEQMAIQFLFFWQWGRLKAYALEKDVRIIGDIPIFVAHDSADVWANQQLFELDTLGQPTVVAGVPPDYFSPTGQRWGNPLYRWDILKESDYEWWLQRLRATLELVDVIRLDHFRGFAACWEVPAEEETAVRGRWVTGPGADFFDHLQTEFAELALIAEDLGLITADVIDLRERYQFPGMKVLQFAFGADSRHAFLPHNYGRNCVVYTGTHDNDTSTGWYRSAPEVERDFLRRYCAVPGTDVAWDLIRLAWSSVAGWAVTPMQDLLSLESGARMNLPGAEAGNWTWRVREGQLADHVQARLREFNQLYNRSKAARGEEEDRPAWDSGEYAP